MVFRRLDKNLISESQCGVGWGKDGKGASPEQMSHGKTLNHLAPPSFTSEIPHMTAQTDEHMASCFNSSTERKLSHNISQE